MEAADSMRGNPGFGAAFRYDRSRSSPGFKGAKFREEGGISSWAFLAMGLQENDQYYNGWWNIYNVDSYEKAEGDRKQQEAAAKEVVRERTEFMRDNPEYALRFFSGKNASQWNNPDFQGFWINSHLENDPFIPPDWVSDVISGKTMWLLRGLLNRLQFIILIGTVLFMLLKRNKGFGFESIGIIVLGGFIFHTFWEAKAQYTLPYFAMMLPMSAVGWSEYINRLKAFLKKRNAWRTFRTLSSRRQSGSNL